MKRADAEKYLCPHCRGRLVLAETAGAQNSETPEEILEGRLTCRICGADFPVRGSIPRFIHF